MGGCCSVSSGGSKQVQNKVKELQEVYPGTNTWFIITPAGELLHQSNTTEQLREKEVVTNICKLKEAAVEFGETMKETECPTIHIKGDAHIFSCYDIGANLLVLYSEMSGEDLENFNTTEADLKAVDILNELRQILSNTAEKKAT